MKGPSQARADEIKKQLRAVGASSYELQKPEIPELVKLLHHDETIQSFVLGFYDSGYGMLVATSKRLLFVDKMFVGLKVEDLPYSTLNAIEHDLGWVFARVKVISRAGEFHFRWVKKSHATNFYHFVDKKILQVQLRQDVEK